MSISNLGFLGTIRRFARENRGVSAVEFAILLPVMLTLYLGGTEVTQGITIKRKTTMVARAIGDLVAQDTSITNGEMTSILSAAGAVVAPYPSGNLKVIVSSVSIDAQKVATVVWSDAWGGATARTPGETVALPQGLDDFTNTTLIWSEASYTYTPIGYFITGTMTLTDKLYLRPRLVAKVCRDQGAQTLC
jgi:Flp pilus assembly protein TadG